MKSLCRKHPSLKSCFWLENGAQSHCRGRAWWGNTRDRKIGVLHSYPQPGLTSIHSAFTPGERKPPHPWGMRHQSRTSRSEKHQDLQDGVAAVWLGSQGRGGCGEGAGTLLLVLCLTLG